MTIRIPLLFQGSKGEKHLYALFDSGADYSCITEEAAAALCTMEKLFNPKRMITAKEGAYVEITHRVALDFYHDDKCLSDEFLIVPDLSEDVIIGAQTLQKWHLKLDFKNNAVITDPRVARLIIINHMLKS